MSTPIGVPSTNSTFARRGVTPGSTGHLALFLFVLHGRRTSGSSFLVLYYDSKQDQKQHTFYPQCSTMQEIMRITRRARVDTQNAKLLSQQTNTRLTLSLW